MIAICNIRPEPCYRRHAFANGLKNAGYTLVDRGRPSSKDDLFVIWNRKPDSEPAAHDWEVRGGTVIVTENGYAGEDSEGRQYYAIAVHGHNGAGWFPVGDEDRFEKLGIELKPFRQTGQHVLVCGQRGIGSRQMASPPNWHETIARSFRKRTERQVRVRAHPGHFKPAMRLEDDLSGAWMCAVWSSSSGVKALAMGVPVQYGAPHWICADGALPLGDPDSNLCDERKRLDAMRYMAWGQRSVDEIETGEVFVRIRENIGDATW